MVAVLDSGRVVIPLVQMVGRDKSEANADLSWVTAYLRDRGAPISGWGSLSPGFIMTRHRDPSTLGEVFEWCRTPASTAPAASEVLFAFVGWMTGRPEPLPVGANCDCAIWADHIKAFADSQGWPDPRDGWHVGQPDYPAAYPGLASIREQHRADGPTSTSASTLEDPAVALFFGATAEVGGWFCLSSRPMIFMGRRKMARLHLPWWRSSSGRWRLQLPKLTVKTMTDDDIAEIRATFQREADRQLAKIDGGAS